MRMALASGLLLSLALAPALASHAGAEAPEGYEALPGCEKQSLLWDRVQASEYEELPGFSPFGLRQILALGWQKLTVKTETRSDFAPRKWKKYLHRRAMVARVQLVPHTNAYTGVFQGAPCALLRLSLTFKPGGKRAVAPGLALKVLRDGVPSGNISALVSLSGQGKDYNFFKNPLTNIVPAGTEFGQKWVHRIFSKVSGYPEELLASDLAAVDPQGQPVESAQAPKKLLFVPASGLVFSSEPHDIRTDLATIPEGTLVYQVYAESESGEENTLLFDVVTTSPFLASAFGDEGMLFRHEVRPKTPAP